MFTISLSCATCLSPRVWLRIEDMTETEPLWCPTHWCWRWPPHNNEPAHEAANLIPETGVTLSPHLPRQERAHGAVLIPGELRGWMQLHSSTAVWLRPVLMSFHCRSCCYYFLFVPHFLLNFNHKEILTINHGTRPYPHLCYKSSQWKANVTFLSNPVYIKQQAS